MLQHPEIAIKYQSEQRCNEQSSGLANIHPENWARALTELRHIIDKVDRAIHDSSKDQAGDDANEDGDGGNTTKAKKKLSSHNKASMRPCYLQETDFSQQDSSEIEQADEAAKASNRLHALHQQLVHVPSSSSENGLKHQRISDDDAEVALTEFENGIRDPSIKATSGTQAKMPASPPESQQEILQLIFDNIRLEKRILYPDPEDPFEIPPPTFSVDEANVVCD
jgi:hypothetical protein